MSKKTAIESLAVEISVMMEEYAEDVAEDMKNEAKEVAKEVVAELKETSPTGAGYGGHYKDGWKSKIEMETSQSLRIRVYNKKKPGLTHLLEKGHSKRGGGRVEGIPHIAPAEKHAAEEYERRLKSRLSK